MILDIKALANMRELAEMGSIAQCLVVRESLLNCAKKVVREKGVLAGTVIGSFSQCLLLSA